MRILIVGSGGREHALAWKVSQSARVKKVFCAPGNGGTSSICENLAFADDAALVKFAEENSIDLTVVGPEAPLVEGLADRLRSRGLAVVGPSADAARLEGSKAFAKEFMARNSIPTAAFKVFDRAGSADAALKKGAFEFPVVVKADGLAAGKGVLICEDLQQALTAVDTIMRRKSFGEGGSRVVVEEFLEGEEASFMVFTDGDAVVPMAPSQDHKSIYDGDVGPNTGGMGAYSVDGMLSDSLRRQVLQDVILPAVEGMKQEGCPFSGILYAGLMLTHSGPKVLEFNARFGDPETQAVLPRLDSDVVDLFEAAAHGELSGVAAEWSTDASVCVVLASSGYPGAYQTGKEITGIQMAEEERRTMVFHAGTESRNGRIVTSGGRVLGVTSLAASLDEAIMKVYDAVNRVHFEGMYYRRDIAAKGLQRLPLA